MMGIRSHRRAARPGKNGGPGESAESVDRPSPKRARARIGAGVISLLASAGLLLGLAGPAGAATVLPVVYAATGSSVGHIHCVNSYGYANGASFAYLEVDPPVAVAAYTGTSYVIWVSYTYEWINGKWTYINEEAWSAPGQYTHVGSSYETGSWSGNQGAGDTTASATVGHYFSVVNDTYWFNSANNIITSYSDSSNIAVC